MKVTGSYLGRSCEYLARRLTTVPPNKNPHSDVWLNCKKSAEAIVPERGMSRNEGERTGREGPNKGSLTSGMSVTKDVESGKRRRPADLREGEWNSRDLKEC
jgi:hypothetical protein